MRVGGGGNGAGRRVFFYKQGKLWCCISGEVKHKTLILSTELKR